MIANTPSTYRPVSPLSSFGKGSTASEVQEPCATGLPAHDNYFIHGDDVISTKSLHYGVRKSKSMFIPLKAPDIVYTNGTPEKPAGPSFSYGNGISSVPIPRMQSRQAYLKTHKSMNFLGLMRNHNSFAAHESNDLNVQIARDRFLHQTTQQRLRDRPSFLFRAKARRQEKFQKEGHISSESSDDTPFPSLAEGISSWKESILRHKARRAAKNIKKGLRRVFGRTSKVAVGIPEQQVDALETHVREYPGMHVQESSSDTDDRNTDSNSEIRASPGSEKNMTIRLVPSTPQRVAIYDFLQDQGATVPNDVAYSESIYSRTTGCQTPDPNPSSLELPLCNESQPKTGSAVILDTVTYHPAKPDNMYSLASCSDSPATWMSWMGSEVARLERNKRDLCCTVANISTPERTGSLESGHVREHAQINDDDTAVAQSRATQMNKPLAELQYNGKLNSESMPVLRPIVKHTSEVQLVENIGFNRPKPPPPPPPIQPAKLEIMLGSGRPRLPPPPPPIQEPRSAEKLLLPVSLTDLVMSSRSPGTSSPTPSEQITEVSDPSALGLTLYPSCGMQIENVSTMSGRTRQRMWKLEPAPEYWRTNAPLKAMLVERANRLRRISATEPPNPQGSAAGSQHKEMGMPISADAVAIIGKNVESQGEHKDEDKYEAEGSGLMGPRISGKNRRLVDSLLSSRRIRITGCSETDSDDAFI
jgi:hypothetical protein